GHRARAGGDRVRGGTAPAARDRRTGVMNTSKIKSERDDLNTGIIVGALVVAWLLYDGVRRIADLFATAGAVTVSTRVPAQEVTVPVGSGAPAVVDSATLVVADVNAVSVGSLVL